ncbi:CPBP family intramembrane glutamic endopeptidase [Methylomonas sp. UP202]|uniref:CPBP family intramembrane glutamic endopeptidase n=1 Tax=unclassified Methylomonas TaxID=2608980 RepID=UPI0024790C39|nr:CPBP family intramembrane glutamic endopeptidase [Methylomonas sp. UP202]WGS85570.1 CPBP family intramembrane metalloprotease [Methylomonas sp. UP202]
MRTAIALLAPLALLLLLAVVAGFIGYGVLLLVGDVLPLAKLVSKITLVLLLLSVWPLKHYLRLDWSNFGFASRQVFFRQMGRGFLLGLASLLPVLIVLYGLGVHVWDDSRVWSVNKVAEKLGLGLFFSLLIGVGEELLFRGLLLTALRRVLPLSIAVLLSSLYYAALHFLKSTSLIPYAELTPFSGMKLLGEAFRGWLNPDILTALIALLVVGCFLAAIRLRWAESLGLCVGCHAAWVWQIKVFRDFFNVNLQSKLLYLVNTYYDGVIGPLVSVWLLLALAGIRFWLSWGKSSPLEV